MTIDEKAMEAAVKQYRYYRQAAITMEFCVLRTVEAYLAALPPDPQIARPYVFTRFVDGHEMAEGIEITQASSLQDAMRTAASICPSSKGKTVLVLQTGQDPQIARLEAENSTRHQMILNQAATIARMQEAIARLEAERDRTLDEAVKIPAGCDRLAVENILFATKLAESQATIARMREGGLKIAKEALEFAVLTLAFHGRDRGTYRQECTLDSLEELARKLDVAARGHIAALAPAAEKEG